MLCINRALLVMLLSLCGSSAYATGVLSPIAMNGGAVSSCDDQANAIYRVESQWEYEIVAASQTDQVFGTTGAAGDLVSSVKCVTSAASVGAVTIKDGTGSAITLFNAQLAANDNLNKDNMNWVSTDGGWKLTTGTNTTCIISGRAS